MTDRHSPRTWDLGAPGWWTAHPEWTVNEWTGPHGQRVRENDCDPLMARFRDEVLADPERRARFLAALRQVTDHMRGTMAEIADDPDMSARFVTALQEATDR